ncbi:MAG: trypsin-like peptidase domain-containing protein [Planctomycetales bacterium]|nr:trypsin-like peptidase domain-containing protein [Planctomycetales bacterium]MCA9167563.1 trypsin-like peptidase domain-containing protein [Planctomycetales bacterium]
MKLPRLPKIGSKLAITACLSLALVASYRPQDVFASPLRRSAIVRAVADARPAVVNIHGHKTLPANGTDAGRKVNGMGTGVIIDERGYIVTNSHVVEGVREIKVTTADSESYIARLVANDVQTDLAIIKINATRSLPLINVGTSRDLMVGEEVIAVGNAFGYEHTVTRGIISALHRTVNVTDTQQYIDLIQADASINPGNSGGPLLNIDGEMIGINVAVRVGAQGIGFAIPVDRAMDIAARLLSAERVGGVWHGIVPVTEAGDATGVVARSVQSGSPAAQAGIQPGDVITRINSLSVRRTLDLERALIGMRAGQEVDFEINRRKQLQQVKVQLVAGSPATTHTVAKATTTTSDAVLQEAWSLYGMRLERLGDRSPPIAHAQFNGGLRIAEVRPGSPAAEEGVVSGDMLVGMHEWVTASPDDLAYVLRSNKIAQMQSIKFYILRGNNLLHGQLPVMRR